MKTEILSDNERIAVNKNSRQKFTPLELMDFKGNPFSGGASM